MMNLKFSAVLVLVAICWGIPFSAQADQNDPRLDILFTKLNSTSDFRRIQHYTQEIWRIWSMHEDQQTNEALKAGLSELYEEDYTASLQHLNTAIDSAPDFAEAWNSRAILYFHQQNYQASLDDIDRVLALEPRHFGALMGQGQCYFHQKKYKQALSSFQQALSINPWLYDAHRNVDKLKALIDEAEQSI